MLHLQSRRLQFLSLINLGDGGRDGRGYTIPVVKTVNVNMKIMAEIDKNKKCSFH